MTLRYIKKTSESVINSDSSVVNDAVEHCFFAFVAEQAQEYPGYFDPMISTHFRRHLYK